MSKLLDALQFAYQNIREVAFVGRDSEMISQVKEALRQAHEQATLVERQVADLTAQVAAISKETTCDTQPSLSPSPSSDGIIDLTEQ